MIDYRKKLTTDRYMNEIPFLDISVESDRGRILSSPAFRRLQKRTQVFALELNASIRTRLTHSLEVGQTARYIAKTILSLLKKEGQNYGLEGLENAFISTVEMTSLLHDIGNPPFGHSAEETINTWIEKNALPMLDSFRVTTERGRALKEQIALDICNYDGNAQAIRVISKLQRLNLSYTQTVSVLKYTRGAFEPKPSKEDALYYLKKKPGFYYSEKEFVGEIKEVLEVKSGYRFPITYIMEAADDISYLTADLEDAVEKGILSLDEVYHIIKRECEKENEDYLLKLIEEKYEQAKQNEEPYQFNLFFTLFRAKIIGALVKHVAKVYVDNHDAVFHGSFNDALLEYDKESPYYKAVKILQRISIQYIYDNRDVEELELQGYTIVNGLLESYKPLLELNFSDFNKLVNGQDKEVKCFVSKRLIRRLSPKQIVAYTADVEGIQNENRESFTILEWYYRVRLLVDYISGMTDDFALEEYKILSAIT
jgi:dGTPase